MKRRNIDKKVAIALLLSFAVASAIAVPVITIHLQKLGAGTSNVISPANVAWVNHIYAYDVNDHQIYLTGVKIKFDTDLPSGTLIHVELRDSTDNVLTTGETTLSSDLSAGSWVIISVNPSLDINGIINYDHIDLVVSGPEVGT